MIRHITTAGLALLAAASLAAEAHAEEQTYWFGAAAKHTNISFVSKTDVEEILGSTNAISGSATVDWDAGTVALDLRVPVASLRTGIAARDGHLRQPQWMDAARFPEIRFVAAKATQRDKRNWDLEGTFTMRGVARPLTLRARVSRIPPAIAKKARFGDGAWIRVSTSFPVTITQHGITIPGGVAPKMQATWTVTLSLSATSAKPQGAPPAAGESTSAKSVKARKVTVDAPGTKFALGVLPQNSNITIESKTDLETVITQTNVLSGEVALDFRKPAGAVKIAVPVRSLRTGIEMRDEHLRSPMWLDAAKHPEITFTSTKATFLGKRKWRVEGDFGMHGVTKRITIEVSVSGVPPHVMAKTGFPGRSGLHFRTSFTVKLSDYGVKLPGIAVGKVSDELKITFAVLGLER